MKFDPLALFRALGRKPKAFPKTNETSYAFPEAEEEHLATVRDRVRNSGLTSVRFVGDDSFIVGDFGAKCCYLARTRGGRLEILDRHDTQLADGTAVETDLMDYHDGRFMVSNFYQGTLSLYQIAGERISFLREVETGPVPNMHGLRFIPGQEELAWLTFCNHKAPRHKVLDLESGNVLHDIETEQQCQDVAFARGHAVVFARTNHISKGAVKIGRKSKKRIMFATAYVYRMPDDLRRAAPELVSEWTGEGHIDASVEGPDGHIYSANQYLDRVDIFRLSETGELALDGVINGFNLPHGLDVRETRVAVTNYGDQTLRVFDLPA